MQLKDFKQQFKAKIQEFETTSSRASRKVVNELPFSNWLYEHLSSKLDEKGFVFDTQGKLIKAIGPVNEYVNSLPDVLIYHGKGYMKTINALTLQVEYPHYDILCDNKVNMEGEEVELIAMAGELKVPCVGDNAINECFYNMFGQGVNLAMKSLSSGNIVKHIVMYGIVVAVHLPEKAKLLQIIMDFESNTSQFKLVAQDYDFTMLLNTVLDEIM